MVKVTDLFSLEDLIDAIDQGYVTETEHPDLPLWIYRCTAKCKRDNVWNDVTLNCDWLIIDWHGEIAINMMEDERAARIGRKTSPSGVQPYVNDSSLPPAIIIDIDGTVAIRGARDPFDESLVHQDQPNVAVISVIQHLVETGYWPVFLSGRSDGCYDATIEWLAKHVVDDFDLYMRKAGDYRKDCHMKMELFDKHVRDRYNVLCVFDDRNQVVDMWRELGLTCMQVAPGDF